MGNIDCCSDRSANPPLLSKYERPDFYKHCQTSNTARFQTEDDGLRNAMLESMRLSYTEQKLKDVEFHLMKKFKTESNNSSTIKTRRERSSSRGSERATWIRIVKVEKVESVIPCFAKENLQNVKGYLIFSISSYLFLPSPFFPPSSFFPSSSSFHLHHPLLLLSPFSTFDFLSYQTDLNNF